MIIAEYSNSVNVTDSRSFDQAIATTQQLIERNEQLIAATVYGNPVDERIVEVDVAPHGNTWRWVKRMRKGMLDRTSTESFPTPVAAALTAERIAECAGATLSQNAQAVLGREIVKGYEKRLFGQSLEACDNHYQHQGYQERMVEELMDAILAEEEEAEAAIGDAQQWPPDDDEPTDDEKWYYYQQYEEDYDRDPCGVYDGWTRMRA